ncbi:NUDIX domain-containing protein [Promicromonospora vindobonensis]|uniref:NUDIX domain-containing protein n=1 Tax=Promicromonospora vindobonensis TaxID=195748 RepID=A0ABW5VNM7_9MICO
MTWVEPHQWYAQLAAFHAAAALFITDDAGRVLLVKPNYRDHWSLPGGYVDLHEAPHQAAERELREELHLDVTAGVLLVVDWASPAGPRPRSLVNFLFDGGDLASPYRLQADPEELDAAEFHTPAQCARLLPPRVAPRVEAALDARARKTTNYLFDGVRPGTGHPVPGAGTTALGPR